METINGVLQNVSSIETVVGDADMISSDGSVSIVGLPATEQVDFKVVGLASAPKAAAAVYGVTRLSDDPAVALTPIALGTNNANWLALTGSADTNLHKHDTLDNGAGSVSVDTSSFLVGPGAKPAGSYSVTIPNRGAGASYAMQIISNQVDDPALKLLQLQRVNPAVVDGTYNWVEWYNGTTLELAWGQTNLGVGVNIPTVDILGFTFFKIGAAGNLFAPAGTLFIKDILTGCAGLSADISGAAPSAASLPSLWLTAQPANGATALGFYHNALNALSTTGARHSAWASALTTFLMELTKDATAWHLDLPQAGSSYYVAGTKVLGARKTGWTAPTGTASRAGFATSTATLTQVAETLKALIDDLHGTAGHGAIGT